MSISTIDRIHDLMATIKPGEVIDYYELRLIASGVKYARYMHVKSPMVVSHDRLQNLEQAFQELLTLVAKHEANGPNELNSQASVPVVAAWNILHGHIYDVKVYGNNGLPIGVMSTSPMIIALLRNMEVQIWRDGTTSDHATKENYVALKRKFEELNWYLPHKLT